MWHSDSLTPIYMFLSHNNRIITSASGQRIVVRRSPSGGVWINNASSETVAP